MVQDQIREEGQATSYEVKQAMERTLDFIQIELEDLKQGSNLLCLD